jgi:hypothetical protein
LSLDPTGDSQCLRHNRLREQLAIKGARVRYRKVDQVLVRAHAAGIHSGEVLINQAYIDDLTLAKTVSA